MTAREKWAPQLIRSDDPLFDSDQWIPDPDNHSFEEITPPVASDSKQSEE